MATVVNNADRGEGTAWGPAILVLVVVLAALAFLVWGVPALQGGAAPAPTNTIDLTVDGGASIPAPGEPGGEGQ